MRTTLSSLAIAALSLTALVLWSLTWKDGRRARAEALRYELEPLN